MAAVKSLATDFEALTFHAQDISSDKLDAELWSDANPGLALALLSVEEVDGLAALARTPVAAASSSAKTIDKSFDICSFAGCGFGVRVVGTLDLENGSASIQTFPYVKTPFKTFQIKGPSLSGSITDGIHVGPVPLGLPYIGTFDLWIKKESSSVAIIVKVTFFGHGFTKKITIPF